MISILLCINTNQLNRNFSKASVKAVLLKWGISSLVRGGADA
jgi:hypothetical protein